MPGPALHEQGLRPWHPSGYDPDPWRKGTPGRAGALQTPGTVWHGPWSFVVITFGKGRFPG